MTDPFRQYFLDSVQSTMNEEPGEMTLLALLKFAIPNLTLDMMYDMMVNHNSNNGKGDLQKCLKTLKSRIHPDKHPGGASTLATKLFQDVSIYYEQCLKVMSSNSSQEYEHGHEHGQSSSSSTSQSSSARTGGVRGGGGRRRKASSTTTSSSSARSGNNNHRKRSSSREGSGAQHTSKKNRDDFPDDFNVYDKWPNIPQVITTASSCSLTNIDDKKENNDSNQNPNNPLAPPPSKSLTRETLPVYQAYKCIHARGAIAHGKPITKFNTWADVETHTRDNDTLHDIFDRIGGGTMELDSIDGIKEELMKRGPVISASFELVPAYLKHLSVGHAENAFVKEAAGELHELLIVGWGLTPYGEAWKVQPLMDDDADIDHGQDHHSVTSPVISIGFGQFGIDHLCLAPMSTLEDISWQPGPYFTSDFSEAPDWREWKEMDLPLTDSEVRDLAKCFKEKGLMSGETFVIRDGIKKAHSAKYCIKNLRWESSTEEWVVTVVLHS